LIGRQHWRPVSEWMKLGVVPVGVKSFNAPQADAFVVIPQTINGPVFLVTRNFMAIMDYNQSHSYALAVGHLGDRIRGLSPFQASWPSAAVDLNPSQRVELQKRLNAMGIQTGGAADGRFGAQTYEAVLLFQKKKGLALDGQPTLKILELLRRGG
jgi:membrane-bound lytic murein transglycosylase B